MHSRMMALGQGSEAEPRRVKGLVGRYFGFLARGEAHMTLEWVRGGGSHVVACRVVLGHRRGGVMKYPRNHLLLRHDFGWFPPKRDDNVCYLSSFHTLQPLKTLPASPGVFPLTPFSILCPWRV